MKEPTGYKKDVDAVAPLSAHEASNTLRKIMITTDTHANRLYITHSLWIC